MHITNLTLSYYLFYVYDNYGFSNTNISHSKYSHVHNECLRVGNSHQS